MLLTCRSTVRSLIPRSAAIARFVLPAASRRSTSTSRAGGHPAARARRRPRRRAGRDRGAAPRSETRDAPPRIPSRRYPRRRAAARRDRSPHGRGRSRTVRPASSQAMTRCAWRRARLVRHHPRGGPRRPRVGRSRRGAAQRDAGHPRQRVRGSRAARQIADGERDLHQRLQQSRLRRCPHPPRRRPGGSPPRRPSAGPGQAAAAPGRAPAGGPTACLAVRRLGIREVAAQPVQLGLLVERLADRGLRRRPREPLLGPSRLVDRLGPRAVESLQLGPIDEAPAAERNEVGLRVAPAASASVHSWARRRSKTSWNASIEAQ